MAQQVKQQLVWIAAVSVIFALCTGLVLTFSDPFTSPWVVFALFYLSACCTATGILTLVFYGVRSLGAANVLHADRLATSVREGFLVSLLVVGSLVLSSRQVLFWWVELSLVVTLVLVEMFFLV
jgi:hypothetical protein